MKFFLVWAVWWVYWSKLTLIYKKRHEFHVSALIGDCYTEMHRERHGVAQRESLYNRSNEKTQGLPVVCKVYKYKIKIAFSPD